MTTPFVAVLVAFSALMTRPDKAFFVMVVIFWVVGALVAVVYALPAYQLLATDLELREDSLVIWRGALNATTIEYSEIEPGTLAIVQSVDTSDGLGKWNVSDLCFRLRSGTTVLLARVGDMDGDELVVEELQAVIGALLQPEREPTTTQPTDSELLVCDGCGSPCVPRETLTVPCEACGESVYVSERLRLNLCHQRELAATERKTTERIRRLLRFPSAQLVNRLFFALHGSIVAVTCLSVWWLSERRFSVAIAAFLLTHVFYQGLRLITARRIAFRALAFLGKSSRVIGGVSYAACRNCGALLPSCDELNVLTRCVYCAQTNLLGVDLPAFAAGMANTRSRLDEILANVSTTNERCYSRLILLGISFSLTLPFLIWS
jgi:hypothetical protein